MLNKDYHDNLYTLIEPYEDSEDKIFLSKGNKFQDTIKLVSFRNGLFEKINANTKFKISIYTILTPDHQ